MNPTLKNDIEQLLLLIWSFIITTLDLITYDGQESSLFIIIVSYITAFVLYFVIGLVTLSLAKGIYNLVKGIK